MHQTKSNLGLTKHLSKVLTLAMLAIVTAVLLQVSPARVDAAPAIPNGDVGALKNAIDDANEFPNPTTITLAKNGDYVLTEALPYITSKITINGRGSTIDGDDLFRVFAVGGVGDLTLKVLTVSEGSASTGGGIWNTGSLTIDNSTISGNATLGNNPKAKGSGIYNEGPLTLHSSTISVNMAGGDGGGIWNRFGPLDIYGSTISGNTAVDSAGGIFNQDGTATIYESTIKNNTAVQDEGGGIWNLGTLDIHSSAISGNTAFDGSGGFGAGILNDGTLHIDSSTIRDNIGFGITNFGTLTIDNSTIKGNTAGGLGDGIKGSFTDSGGNTFLDVNSP